MNIFFIVAVKIRLNIYVLSRRAKQLFGSRKLRFIIRWGDAVQFLAAFQSLFLAGCNAIVKETVFQSCI